VSLRASLCPRSRKWNDLSFVFTVSATRRATTARFLDNMRPVDSTPGWQKLLEPLHTRITGIRNLGKQDRQFNPHTLHGTAPSTKQSGDESDSGVTALDSPASAFEPFVHLQVERRQYEQREERGRDQSSDHHDGQRAFDLRAVEPKDQQRQ
jgi:hypothetical protein